MREIFRAIPEQKIVVRAAAGEVVRDPLNPRSKAHPLTPYLEENLLLSQDLAEDMLDTFMSLVGAAPPDDLDDGEAATLTHAEYTGAVAVLDERKARRIAAVRFKKVRLLSTVDILRRPEVTDSLGSALPIAVFSALKYARMRVLHSDREWVCRLIGEERARECASLGRSA
jgi:hypothetical protein